MTMWFMNILNILINKNLTRKSQEKHRIHYYELQKDKIMAWLQVITKYIVHLIFLLYQ